MCVTLDDYDKYMEWREQAPEPKYCRHCGRKLIENTAIDHYDEYTGKPVKAVLPRKICPSFQCRVGNRSRVRA